MLCHVVLCHGVVWCGVVWCGVAGVVWCGVVWCGVVWCGVVWCGVVWCGVVWCGVVWCAEGAVTKWQWTGWSCIRVMQAGRAVYLNARCVLYVVHLWQQAISLSGAGQLLPRAALGTRCRSA